MYTGHCIAVRVTNWQSVADTGGLTLAVEGPSKAEIDCVDNKDGTCSASYLPTVPGEYSIIIKFADQHIAGSPFTANIASPCTRPLLCVYLSLAVVKVVL